MEVENLRINLLGVNKEAVIRVSLKRSERDEFLRANDYLEKSSFQSLMKLDMDTISDIARIESMRGKITFREIWEFWERNHTAKRVLKLWDACDEYSGEGNGIIRRVRFIF